MNVLLKLCLWLSCPTFGRALDHSLKDSLTNPMHWFMMKVMTAFKGENRTNGSSRPIKTWPTMAIAVLLESMWWFSVVSIFKQHYLDGKLKKVVSTVISGILFARFPTVKCIPTICSFLLTSLTVEAKNKRRSTALSAFYL